MYSEDILENMREIKLGVWEGFFVSKILEVGDKVTVEKNKNFNKFKVLV